MFFSQAFDITFHFFIKLKKNDIIFKIQIMQRFIIYAA